MEAGGIYYADATTSGFYLTGVFMFFIGFLIMAIVHEM